MSSIMEKIVHAALFTPTPEGWGLPILFWGKPGVAKSAIIRIASRQFQMPVEVLSPGERGEGAFGVTPVPVIREGGSILTYPRPDWSLQFDEDDEQDGRGVVFVDELVDAPMGIRPALHGLLLDRRIGGHYLGRGVRILAASNTADISTSGIDLSMPIANRLGHIDWQDPSAAEFTEWLMSADVTKPNIEVIESAAKREKRVMDKWPLAFAKSRGLVAGFIKKNTSILHKMPANTDPNASRAWPSHRTWAFAAMAIAGSDVNDLDGASTDLLVQSFVGPAAMSELITYRAALDLPDPEQLLENKVTWKHNPTRLDRSVAVFTSCTSFVSGIPEEKRRKKLGANLWKLMNNVVGEAPDLLVSCLKPLANKELTNLQEAIPVLAAMRPMLNAVGLSPTGTRNP